MKTNTIDTETHKKIKSKGSKKRKNKDKKRNDERNKNVINQHMTETTIIDDLFDNLDKRKKQKKEQENNKILLEIKEKQKEKEEIKRFNDTVNKLDTSMNGKGGDGDPRPVRFDKDGLAIYSEESLKINAGGDTSNCPFDCWCCF